jgi:hypothetical protein
MGSGEGVEKLNTMKPKVKQLGELGVSEYLTIGPGKTVYRTITYVGRWNAQTKRDCLNMTTLRAEYLFCRERVILVQLEKGNDKLG